MFGTIRVRLVSGLVVGALAFVVPAPSRQSLVSPVGLEAAADKLVGVEILDETGRPVLESATIDLRSGRVTDAEGRQLLDMVVPFDAAPMPDGFSSPLQTVFAGDSNGIVYAACSFDTLGDYVHKSSGQASGHGWWKAYSGCNPTARVKVQLQELFSNGVYYVWYNRGTVGNEVVTSGGGAGNRSTGKATCNTSDYVGWRSVVDVDIIGQSDPGDWLYTPASNIYCKVP
jgi:hypothetical protein